MPPLPHGFARDSIQGDNAFMLNAQAGDTLPPKVLAGALKDLIGVHIERPEENLAELAFALEPILSDPVRSRQLLERIELYTSSEISEQVSSEEFRLPIQTSESEVDEHADALLGFQPDRGRMSRLAKSVQQSTQWSHRTWAHSASEDHQRWHALVSEQWSPRSLGFDEEGVDAFEASVHGDQWRLFVHRALHAGDQRSSKIRQRWQMLRCAMAGSFPEAFISKPSAEAGVIDLDLGRESFKVVFLASADSLYLVLDATGEKVLRKVDLGSQPEYLYEAVLHAFRGHSELAEVALKSLEKGFSFYEP